MKKERIEYLYQCYLNGSLNKDEYQELKRYLLEIDNQQEFNKLLDDTWSELSSKDLLDLNREKSDEIFYAIIKKNEVKKYRLRKLINVAAAAVFILVCAVVVLFYKKINENSLSERSNLEQEILPGGNRAFLTLDNGENIDLSSEKSEIKISETSIAYADGAPLIQVKNNDNSTRFFVLSTPKGGEYQVTLSDGTKVWLNSESKLKYPCRFIGKERRVMLEGEGYFEVAKSKDKPFYVESKAQEIKVLGTHFNVNTYEGSIKTTLVEGKVEVSKTASNSYQKAVVLKPGEQSLVQPFLKQILVTEVNTLEFLDWKDGFFVFNNEPIKSIAKRLSRWYDVDFLFQGNVDNVKFTGNYSRSKSLSNLLKNIELTGTVKFKMNNTIEGRRIMIIANY